MQASLSRFSLFGGSERGYHRRVSEPGTSPGRVPEASTGGPSITRSHVAHSSGYMYQKPLPSPLPPSIPRLARNNSGQQASARPDSVTATCAPALAGCMYCVGVRGCGTGLVLGHGKQYFVFVFGIFCGASRNHQTNNESLHSLSHGRTRCHTDSPARLPAEQPLKHSGQQIEKLIAQVACIKMLKGSPSTTTVKAVLRI